MFKMVTEIKGKNNTILACEMKPLDIAVVVDNEYKDDIIMRTASMDKFEALSLANPGLGKCWEQPNCSLRVKLLPPGTEITLMVL